MPLLLFPPWSKTQQQAQTAYKDEANTFTLAGNNFDEILAVDKGLQFPATQVAATGANVLDDYEEGTWTPTMTADGGSSGQTYTSRTGRYIKIGKLVTIYFSFELSAKGTLTGSLQVGGLPFTSDSPAVQYSGTLGWGTTVTSFYSMFTTMGENVGAAYIRGMSAAGTSTTTIATAAIGNDTSF